MKALMRFNIIIPITALFFVVIYAFLLLLGIRSVNTENKQTSNTSHYGFSYIYRLLKELGYKVKRVSSYRIESGKNCFIMINNEFKNDVERKQVLSWVKGGGVLFLIGEMGSERINSEYKLKTGSIQNISFKKGMGKDVKNLNYNYGSYFVGVSEENILVNSNQGALIIKVKTGKGVIFAAAGASFFNNGHIKKENAAVIFNNILGKYYDEKYNILFLEKAPEYRVDKNPVMILFRGRIFFITMHVILMVLLFCFWKAKRFGNAMSLNPYGRRKITEHIAAVGDFYRKAKKRNLIEKLEIDYFITVITNRLRISRSISAEALADRVSLHLKTCSRESLISLLTIDKNLDETELCKRRKKRDDILNKINNQKERV